MQIPFTSVAEVVTRIIPIIADSLAQPATDISLDSKFETDLGADSLDRVYLTMQLEERLAIDIPDEVAEKLLTGGNLMDYVESKMNPMNTVSVGVEQVMTLDGVHRAMRAIVAQRMAEDTTFAKLAMGQGFYNKFKAAVDASAGVYVKPAPNSIATFSGIPMVVDPSVEFDTCEARNSAGNTITLLRA